MRRLFILFAAAACTLALAGSAWANALADSKFALHLKSRTTKSTTICTSWSPVPVHADLSVDTLAAATPCSSFVTKGDVLKNYDVYLVIAETNDNGIAGLSCGLKYTGGAVGVAVYSWTRCSNLEFASGGWPANGGGNRITWAAQTHCQNRKVPPHGVQTVAGSFYIYAYGPDRFELDFNRNVSPPELLTADCNAKEGPVERDHAGWVEFSAGAATNGCNPCAQPCTTAVAASTWGKIKSQY